MFYSVGDHFVQSDNDKWHFIIMNIRPVSGMLDIDVFYDNEWSISSIMDVKELDEGINSGMWYQKPSEISNSTKISCECGSETDRHSPWCVMNNI